MTRPDTAVLCQGQFRVGDASHVYRISQRDFTADVASAGRLLATLGVGRGDHLLVISLLSEAASYWPIARACAAAGVIFSAADTTPFDAARVRMFCAQLPLKAVLGVHPETISGLSELGADPQKIFADVAAVAARPGAYESLEGLRTRRRWLQLGPALAAECEAACGAHVDDELWAITAEDGEILISSVGERLQRFERQSTGVAGEISSEACACGRSGARVIPTRGTEV